MTSPALFSLASRGASAPLASAFTALITLSAPVPVVFRELADIENLPRWAGGFCERVDLRRGGWVGLTSLGELYFALEANERAGEITLWAGWTAHELRPLPLRVAADDHGRTRVTFRVEHVGDEGHERLCRALGAEWPGLVGRLGGVEWGGAGW
jgi:uncharacterized protein YndB with AHSA1/START domain